jgi:hypothetical protein
VTYTTAGQYGFVVLSGSDSNGDGVLNIAVISDYVWVAAGLDVATPGSLPALPQAAGFARPTPGDAVTTLTDAQLQPIVVEAINRWAAAGADPAVLSRVQFRIGDLDGLGRLGEASPGYVTIDDDAYGATWFVDATPGDDAEFTPTGIATELRSLVGESANRVDLLTVVMHELGHELLMGDVDGSLLVGDLMSETLTTGVRRLPGAILGAPVFGAPSATNIQTRIQEEPSVRPLVDEAFAPVPVADPLSPAKLDMAATMEFPLPETASDDPFLSGVSLD